MNRAATDHPQVTAYLRRLDVALAVVPAGPARELREQITGHLDEALPPGASDQEVAEELRRLGRPADLAAEAVATAGKRPWLARVGWRRWSVTALAVILIAGLAGYLAPSLTAGPLVFNGASSWWYAQDWKRQVETSADGATQTTVPIRQGQWQGFMMQLENDTDQPQTVLGAAAGIGIGSSPYRVGLASEDPDHLRVVNFRTFHYGLPVTIPPHQSRFLRVLWISRACLQKGASQGTDELSLRVRVGLFTRTEKLSLYQGWYLAGPDACG
jgi:hypothetical protein